VSLLLNATGLEIPGRISHVQFIDLAGGVLMEMPTQLYATRPALYNVSNIVTPTQFFYIKVAASPPMPVLRPNRVQLPPPLEYNVKYTDIAVGSLSCRTATHMPHTVLPATRQR